MYNRSLIVFLIGILTISPFISIKFMNIYAQQLNSISQSSTIVALTNKMTNISNSDKPEDVATLAYIWGYPLITMKRSFDYFTYPATNTQGAGPADKIHFSRELTNASFKDSVSPNSDTLYGWAWLNLSKEPLVLKVPPIEKDRYYSFQFTDAYTNDYAYVGKRATGSEGGTFLITGPNWNGTVPEEMTKIWSPTNLDFMFNRILVKGPTDLNNVHAIQDKISVIPLSVYFRNNDSSVSTEATKANTTVLTNNTTASDTPPINSDPQFIPTTGIKIYDEIGKDMIGNPLYPADPALVKKFASIGIGPGKEPSLQTNETIRKALETGITEGEKLIDAKVANVGFKVNGWLVSGAAGVFGTDYLFRAAVTKYGFGATIAQEALYPITFSDMDGNPLSGANNYTIHFAPRQIPPVHAFWSITMYNNKHLFVDNPLNRYSIGKYTEGLKYNQDGSLDIYLQNLNPGPSKESNWLPAPKDSFNLTLRMYLPDDVVLNGTWSPPPVVRSR